MSYRLRRSQKERWPERQESIEASERAIRHQDVDPRIDAEPAREQMSRGDLIGTRNLKLQALEAHRTCALFDVKQDGGEIGGVDGCDRPGSAAPDECKAPDAAVSSGVDVCLAMACKPSKLAFLARMLEHVVLDRPNRLAIRRGFDVERPRGPVASELGAVRRPAQRQHRKARGGTCSVIRRE